MRHVLQYCVVPYLTGVAAGCLLNVQSVQAQEVNAIAPAVAEVSAPQEPQPAELPEVDLPARTTKFVSRDEPYEMDFFRADPKLLEQRFVTVLKFDFPLIQQLFTRVSRGDSLHAGFLDVETYQLWFFLELYNGDLGENFAYFGSGRDSPEAPTSLEEFVQVLARRAPSDRKPADEILKRLAQAGREGHLRLKNLSHSHGGYPGQGGGGFAVQATPLGEITILSPSIEEGEQLARALLTLLDYGLSRPSMQEALQARQEAQRQLGELEEKLAENQQRVTDLEAQLTSDAEVSADDLVSLKTQLHLLAVDVAGAEARIRATQEILAQLEAELKHAEERIQQGARQAVSDRYKSLGSHVERVENIKITAEIDLASLAARRAMLEEIIGRGTERKKLESQLGAQRQRADNFHHAIQRTQATIQTCDDYFVRLGPLRLVDNEAVTRPIRWRQPEGR